MGNKGNKANANRSLNEKEIKLLTAKTGLSKQEITDWHKQFLSEYPDGIKITLS
jgi:hypothetical protein